MQDEDFDGLTEGLRDAIAYARGDASRGRLISALDVKDIRKATGLSQARFADAYGLEVRSVQAWEQGVRSLDASTRTLYRLIRREPERIRKLVAAGD